MTDPVRNSSDLVRNALGGEFSLAALREACKPGKQWSDEALRGAPEELRSVGLETK